MAAVLEERVEENILSCPKDIVTGLFGERNYVNADDAEVLAGEFLGARATFRPRNEVEQDDSVVQALPIVVVRNADGDVLRLRRREKANDNPLHEKLVIWAGGHVCREDADNGNPLIHCAIRELDEELRLEAEGSSLHLLGAIYFDGERIGKHVAIAYEWRAQTNDVPTVLSRSEFFEGKDASLSGTFSSVEQLVQDVQAKPARLSEAWSVELVRSCLAAGAMKDLFSNA